MNTVARDTLKSNGTTRWHRVFPDAWTIGTWLTASLITAFFALMARDSTIIGDVYLPLTNDSFYHARRILDAAVGERGFYDFDNRLHVPEGAWISWPWAYDYLMAKATQVALWISPSIDPMAFISYVPVAWIFVNAALFLAAATAGGLSREMRLLAMFCFAFSPLTQILHSFAMIDHHYVEETFVLLNAWLGLRWFQQPNDGRRAALLGAALGAATAFHNGLFILQLFSLITVFILWLRRSAPAAGALRSYCVALVVTTFLFLVPSGPFRSGMFEFGLHSWFHLYIAICTAAALGFMAWRSVSRLNFGLLAALCAVLAVPISAQMIRGAGFLSGSFSILDTISEVASPYRMFTESYGPYQTAGYYSWLLLLTPALLAFYGYRLLRERQPERLYYAVVVVLGIALLLDQLRLHVFGWFGLVTGALLLVDQIRTRLTWHRGIAFVGTLATLVLAFQPALRGRLFVYYAPAADPDYASIFPLFLDLHELCAAEPGTVLASSDDGNPLLFHTDCSVIANNFILRREDKAHIDEVDRLMQLPPERIRAERPDIRYLLVRAQDFSIHRDGVVYFVTSNPVAKQLFVDPVPPEGFELVQTIRLQLPNSEITGPYARLYKVVR